MSETTKSVLTPYVHLRKEGDNYFLETAFLNLPQSSVDLGSYEVNLQEEPYKVTINLNPSDVTEGAFAFLRIALDNAPTSGRLEVVAHQSNSDPATGNTIIQFDDAFDPSYT